MSDLTSQASPSNPFCEGRAIGPLIFFFETGVNNSAPNLFEKKIKQRVV